MRASLLTFGCRVNQAESQAIERELVAAGAEIVDSAHAEVIIVNSCSVTATADQGTRQSIRRVARENPSARIVVTGCYATRAPGDVTALLGVVRVVPNSRKDNTAQEALDVMHSGAEVLPHVASWISMGAVRDRGSAHPASTPTFYGNRTAFTLRVQTGCEESCSYCVIPSTRGAERS